MKLIGSRMESEFREQLKESLLNFSANYRLVSALESDGHNTSRACTLQWIPEQGEDIFVVLIDGSYLVSVELSKFEPNTPPIFERTELKDYRSGLSRMHQIQLLVAQELVNEKT
mgnify:FL=1